VTETLILYLVAKFAIAASFLILYPFAGELYPTEIRGIGIGFTAYLGGLGLVAIPFVNYLVNNTAFYRKEVVFNKKISMTGFRVVGAAPGGDGYSVSNWRICRTAPTGDAFPEAAANAGGRRGVWQGLWFEAVHPMLARQVQCPQKFNNLQKSSHQWALLSHFSKTKIY
jgi:hypothetical protein